jgi:hypothetical protein
MKKTAPALPAPGETYVLENAEGFGAGLGHLSTGSLAVVVEVHPAGTAGVGHAGKDAVVLSHEYETHVLTDDGELAPGTAVRNFSLHLPDFTRLFKKVDA